MFVYIKFDPNSSGNVHGYFLCFKGRGAREYVSGFYLFMSSLYRLPTDHNGEIDSTVLLW